MFDNFRYITTNMRNTLLALALLGGSVATQAAEKDSLTIADYFYLEGLRQQEMGNLTAAYDLLRHAHDLNPRSAAVYYQLAGYYVNMKNDALARTYFEKAASLDPENATYQEKLGQLYITQKDYPNAIKAYELLYSSNKTRVDVLQLLLQLYGSQNDYKKMINVLDRIEVLEGSSEQISLSKMQRGDKKKEYESLKSLVDEHPLELDYRVMFGNWLLQNGKKNDALKEYKSVLKEEPNNALAKLSMLDYYRSIKDQATVDELTNEYQQANISDSAKVMSLFSLALSTKQEDADLIMMKAAYMAMKNMPKAEINHVYEQAIDVEPDNSRARLALIQNIWATEDYDKVIEICRPAIEYNPDEMAFYYFKGMAEFQKHDIDAALETFKKGVGQIKKDSDPEIVSDFYAILGDILHEKGKASEAFDAYDSCLKWKADNYGALNNYAYYLSVANKDLPRAEQMSYKTIKAEPNNATYLDTYAWILFQQQRYEEAKIYIDQVLRNDKDPSGVVLEHVGDIYMKTGDTQKALEYWQKAIEKGNDSKVLKDKLQQKKYIAGWKELRYYLQAWQR